MALMALMLLSAMAQEKNEPVVLAYVSAGSEVMPDVTKVTHICYAFGHVEKTFDRVRVHNPDRLHKIAKLKEINPKLKIMLSVGGWGSGNFSEMADNDSLRESFVNSCAAVVKDFGIDGIDIDWEYPGVPAAGISCGPNDRKNFSQLMHDLRRVLGPDGMLMLATQARARAYNFDEFLDDVNFVNVMSYDMGQVPRHHAPLYNSEQFPGFTCEKAVQAHLDRGVPREKIVLGLPFYGHGNKTDIPYYMDWKDLGKYSQFEQKWDDTAKVPYLVNDKGEIVGVFDNPKSLELKCQWAKQQGLRGVMYWEYTCDDPQGTLRTVVFETMNK